MIAHERKTALSVFARPRNSRKTVSWLAEAVLFDLAGLPHVVHVAQVHGVVRIIRFHILPDRVSFERSGAPVRSDGNAHRTASWGSGDRKDSSLAGAIFLVVRIVMDQVSQVGPQPFPKLEERKQVWECRFGWFLGRGLLDAGGEYGSAEQRDVTEPGDMARFVT